MLIAGASFAIMNVFVKLVSHIPTMEVVFFRALFSLFASYIILKKLNVSVWGNNKKLLVARGLAGCLGLMSSFYTLQNIPLASAVTLNYLSPLFTAIIGIFTVKQKLHKSAWFYFALALIGVIIIKGFDTRISFLDVCMGLGAALFAGLAYNIIAMLKTSEHPLVVIFYFPLVTLPITFVFILFDWKTPQNWDWFYLLMVGIMTQIAQYFMTKSYQNANLAKVSIINYLGVVYALITGYFLFDETYTWTSILGIVIIISAVILNVISPKKIQS